MKKENCSKVKIFKVHVPNQQTSMNQAIRNLHPAFIETMKKIFRKYAKCLGYVRDEGYGKVFGWVQNHIKRTKYCLL